jgi:CubicO group peptidase (beta-lactamase class C family)
MPHTEEIAAHVAQASARLVHRRGPRALIIGVVRGEVEYLQGRSLTGADARPTPDTLFEIGSVTKAVTGVALAMTTQRERVSLDDPLHRFLSRAARVCPGGRDITLAMLATHSSGLPRLPPRFRRRAVRHSENPYAGYSAEELLAALEHSRLRNPPGTRYRYSNFGAGLLGYVLTLIHRAPYERLVTDLICEPLGMRDTTVTLTGEQWRRLAHGRSRLGRPAELWDFGSLVGCGGLRSTGADMLRFLSASLAPPASDLGRALDLAQRTRITPSRRLGVGLGWHVLASSGGHGAIVWHNGGTGGFRSFAAFEPGTATGVVLLGNAPRRLDEPGFMLLRAVARCGERG